MGESTLPVTGATGQDPNAVYPLGSSSGESARLQRQAEELAADSAALLDRVGLRPGQAAIDLGCCATRRTRPSTGSGTSSRPPSAATEPTRG